MKNSMDEEFQNALEEHKKGNQQNASRLYQGILNIVPSHPDANHNLGLILETNGKAKLALPLFKNALEASPSTELFWLSYINSLIENQDISNAFEVIEQSRQMGWAEDKLNSLEVKILSKIDTNSIRPQDKRAAIEVWIKQNSQSGNVHLSIDNATCKKIPFHDKKVWLRPTSSDVARVHEFLANLYFKNSYLHERLTAENPTTLIDIGANIGLASLSLIEEFSSIKKVIAIEADDQNFSVLNANFKLWEAKSSSIEWTALNAVATHSDKEKLLKTRGLYDLKPGHSASGTFRYIEDSEINENDSEHEKVISIKSILDKIPTDEKIILKVDIEGGEEHLFKSNTEWLGRCHYLTCEVHDRFHPKMVNSSKNMIEALLNHNFAFFPSDDVLHCYNRDKLSVDEMI